MENQFLTNPKLNFIIFGGKGGSGKTTVSCATALHFGQKFKNKKFLVVSTDPAPSIGDSFDVEVGNKITKIQDNIWAYEMDAGKLLEDFNGKYMGAIRTIMERGTYLDKEDVQEFTKNSLPGMDEVMAIMKIAEFLRMKEYDLIILDTAPTGHTKVLLSLPKAMRRWLKVGDLMMAKHRFLMKRIRGKYVKDECDKFLESISKDIDGVNRLLKNHETTEFIPVTILEPMSILEIALLLQDLERMEIEVKSIIANRIMMDKEKCSFCASRMKEKEKYNKMIEKKFGDYQILKMPLFPTEIRGKESLNEYAEILFGERKFKIMAVKNLQKFSKIPQGKMADFLKKDLNFVICGGKGGVGKTSIAATTAIALAQKNEDKKILITTTDPAHALSNIFEQDIPLNTKIVQIRGVDNLFALETDAQRKIEDWKNKYKRDIEEFFESFTGSSVEVVYDKQVLRELTDLSPPGLEELMALGEIMDLMKERKYDIYVLDSAASGHLLRFLELPNLVRDWLKSIFKILRKYQGFKLEGIAQKMVNLSKDVRKIQEILFYSPKTEFIMITIAEEMGVREMGDLAESLKKLNVNYNYIIANFVTPVPVRNSFFDKSYHCNFCLTKRNDQEKYLNIIKKQHPEKELILVPLLAHDIRGKHTLEELAKILYGG
ncbi:ArsA family ATPase [Patescibacteria group bacterium]